MTRLGWVLAAVLSLAAPASALAASSSIPVPRVVPSDVPGWPSSELGPVVLADGSVVLGLMLRPRYVTYEHVMPGSPALHLLWTQAVADPATSLDGPKTPLALQAAGGGYLVARQDFAACPSASTAAGECHGSPTRSDVTLFGVHGEAPRVLMHCEGAGCAACFPSTSPTSEGELWTAGDTTQVLIDPLCADGTPGPGVIDLATGSVTRFSFPPNRFGEAQQGTYELAGDYVATPDGVLNFRTAAYQILGQGTDWQQYEFGVWGFALLPSGQAIYGFNNNLGHTIVAEGRLYESTPGQDDHALPVTDYGYVDAVHGDRIVMHGGSPVTVPRSPSEIVQTDGTVLGRLAVESQFTGFDGNLAAGLEPGCRHDYLLLWEVAAGPPSTTPSDCAPPTLGPVRLGPHTLAVRVTCPVKDVQDCGATLSLAPLPPATPRAAVRLGAGKQRWVTLIHRLSRGRCRLLAKRRGVLVHALFEPYPAGADPRLRLARHCPH
jgi:hypothetical protein